MDSWGLNLKSCGLVIAEMAAIGLGLNKYAFSDKIINGDFYLSPPGIDLSKSSPGKLLTAFHHDFDLLTLHGKSRYAGLYAWLNTGEKFLVQVPTGHLLVQGGKQLEWMTGGYIKAGFHEVIHN
jgi:isopenicillin N synthase-like dioxygenase